jgi:hypothetical protein
MTVSVECCYSILKCSGNELELLHPDVAMKKLKVKQHHFQMNSSVKLPEGNSTPEQIIVSLRLLIKVNFNKGSKSSVNSDLSAAIDGEVGPCRKYDELDRACFP